MTRSVQVFCTLNTRRSTLRRLLSAAALIGVVPAEPASAARRGESSRAGSNVPTMRPGALDSIPSDLKEVGWDTDLPALLVIRYFPQRTSFKAGWDTWALSYYFHRTRSMKWPQPDPWPPFFINADPGANGSGYLVLGWPEEQRQLFEEWCIKRSRVIPKTIVHAVRLVKPVVGTDVVLRPYGLDAETAVADQRVLGVGFSLTIELGLDASADRYAVTVPPTLVAQWPQSGLLLETRVDWNEPIRENGTLLIAGRPRDLRVTLNGSIIWSHTYPA